jgi:hypothetical protein
MQSHPTHQSQATSCAGPYGDGPVAPSSTPIMTSKMQVAAVDRVFTNEAISDGAFLVDY